MNRKMVAISGVLIVVLCIGAWWWYTVQQKAERKLKNVLLEYDMQDEVQYTDVSYNPLNKKLAVKDVILGKGEGAQFIEHAIVYEFDRKDNDIPLRIGLNLEGIKVDLERQGAYKEGGKEVALVAMGYKQFEAYVNIDYHYMPDDKEVALHVTVGAENLGELEFEGDIANIDMEKIVKNIAETNFTNPFAIGGMLQAIREFSIAHIEMKYEDDGIVEQYMKLMDARSQKWPDDPSIWDRLDEREEEQYKELVELGFPNETARHIASELYSFIESRGSISFATDIDEPIRLASLFSSRRQNPAVKFYQMSKASISGD